ncbi:MAG: nuclear transport factor 2 family protein [Bacteroidota bacterium]
MPGPALADVDARAIRALHDVWVRAEIGGDIDRLLGCCAPDICWITDDGFEVEIGLAAGRRLFASPLRLLDLQTEITDLYGAGGVAYKSCRYQARHQAPDGTLTASQGTHLWILHQRPEGWRVSLVTWCRERPR